MATGKSVCILLIGPGYPRTDLNLRKKLKKNLRRRKWRAIVMEDEPEDHSYPSIEDKFEGILDTYDPNLIICILTRKGVPSGINWEAKAVIDHYGRDEAARRSRFLIHYSIHPRRIPVYIRSVLTRTIHLQWVNYKELFQFIQVWAKEAQGAIKRKK